MTVTPKAPGEKRRILAGIVGYLMRVFSYPESAGSAHIFNTFYREEENSLDGVYLGASSSYRFWIAPMAYQQHGFALSSLATAGQTLTPSSMTDALIRRVTDNMKLSSTRKKAIDYSLEYASQRIVNKKCLLHRKTCAILF